MRCEDRLCDSVHEEIWLYRGVPAESAEVDDVAANAEVYPRRPGYVGEYSRYCHSVNEMTDTGYTSWTTDVDIARALAQYASDESGLSGEVVIFKVRISTIDARRIFEGEDREDEYLIEGTVEDVRFFEDADHEHDG